MKTEICISFYLETNLDQRVMIVALLVKGKVKLKATPALFVEVVEVYPFEEWGF